MRPTSRPLIGLLLGAGGIAFAPIFVRLSELPPTATAFWRIALSLPVLWGWVAIARPRRVDGDPGDGCDGSLEPGAGHGGTAARDRSPGAAADVASDTLTAVDRRRRPRGLVLLAGLMFAGDLAVWHTSIRYTSIAHATLLANCAPLFVTLLSWLLWKQRFGPRFLMGLATALTGAALLIGQSMELHDKQLLGDVLGLLTAVFYGGYLITVKQLRRELPALELLAGAGTVTAIVLLVLASALGETLIATTAEGWAVLVGLALVSHVGGQGLIAWALAHLRAAFSSVALLLQPAIAALLAWILFDESLTPVQSLGAAVILAGIVIARRGS